MERKLKKTKKLINKHNCNDVTGIIMEYLDDRKYTVHLTSLVHKNPSDPLPYYDMMFVNYLMSLLQEFPGKSFRHKDAFYRESQVYERYFCHLQGLTNKEWKRIQKLCAVTKPDPPLIAHTTVKLLKLNEGPKY
jgi:hypothetical protein